MFTLTEFNRLSKEIALHLDFDHMLGVVQSHNPELPWETAEIVTEAIIKVHEFIIEGLYSRRDNGQFIRQCGSFPHQETAMTHEETEEMIIAFMSYFIDSGWYVDVNKDDEQTFWYTVNLPLEGDSFQGIWYWEIGTTGRVQYSTEPAEDPERNSLRNQVQLRKPRVTSAPTPP